MMKFWIAQRNDTECGKWKLAVRVMVQGKVSVDPYRE